MRGDPVLIVYINQFSTRTWEQAGCDKIWFKNFAWGLNTGFPRNSLAADMAEIVELESGSNQFSTLNPETKQVIFFRSFNGVY